MKDNTTVTIYLDDETTPLGEYQTPISFELDTRKIVDGNHTLKVVSKDQQGKEGIKLIPFTVRNGPAIAVEGLRREETVEGVLPLMINAYGKGDQKSFLLHGSETPQSLPWWLVVGIILFIGWAVFFIITSLSVKL